MKAYVMEHSTAAAASVTIPVVAIAWLMMVPGVMSLGTFSTAVALAIGAGAITLKTWQSSQATRTIAHVLNEAETGGHSGRDTASGRVHGNS